MTVVGFPLTADVPGALGPNQFNVKQLGAAGNGTTDDTAVIQGILNTVCAAGGGYIFFPEGTYKLTAALVLNCSGVTLAGANRSGCILSQSTANIPVIKTGLEDVSFIVIEDLTLTYAAAQGTANTGAIALQFGITGGIGDGWYFWDVQRLRITNANTAIGIAGTGSLPVWNCLFDDILMNTISNQLLYFISPVAVGMPINNFRRITHINSGIATGNTYAISMAMEASFDGLDIEDWSAMLVFSDASPVRLQGIHIERWTAAVGGNAFYVVDAPVVIENMTIAGTIDAGGNINLFSAINANGRIAICNVTNVLTIANAAGFRTVYAAGPVTVENINEAGSTAHTFASATSLPFIQQLPVAIVPFSTATDQTGSRALNTDYVNLTRRRVIHVTVTCAATIANAATAGYETTIGGTNFDFANDVGANAGVIESGNYQMTFEVDPGGTYAVNSATGGTSTVTLVRWVEVDQ